MEMFADSKVGSRGQGMGKVGQKRAYQDDRGQKVAKRSCHHVQPLACQ